MVYVWVLLIYTTYKNATSIHHTPSTLHDTQHKLYILQMLNKMKHEWGYGSATELREWGRGVDMQIFSPDRRSMAFRCVT